MVLEKEVLMIINQYNIKYYEERGYKGLKNGARIMVSVEDLPPTSGVKIHTVCKYCGRVFEKAYRRYYETRDDTCCSLCKQQKVLKNTREKYGVSCTLHLPEIEEKVRKQNLDRYGVETPLESFSIREKCKQTMREKYGCEYTLQSPSLRDKVNSTLKSHGKEMVYTSRQQKHLHKIYGGELNHLIGSFFVDLFFPENNICLEYDGSGHDLHVKLGIVSREDFDRKEKERVDFLIEKGYRIIKLISKTDKLPSDTKLLEIKDMCFDKIQNNVFYSYNLDTDSESFEW